MISFPSFRQKKIKDVSVMNLLRAQFLYCAEQPLREWRTIDCCLTETTCVLEKSLDSRQIINMYKSTSSTFAVLLLVICLVLPAQAIDCTSGNTTTCGTGACAEYVFIKGNCISSCPAGTYYQSATNTCESCSGLGSTDCSVKCPSYYYLSSSNSTNGTNSTSSSSSSNSSNMTSSTCLPCSKKFKLGCIGCTTTVCTTCDKGLTLNTNNLTCHSVSCDIAFCLTCLNISTCSLCEEGYSGSNCNASTCTVQYCSQCTDSSSCLICTDGYTLTAGNLCQPACSANCVNCPSPNVCARCATNYILNTTSYTCKLNCSSYFNGNCDTCISFTNCIACKTGFKVMYGGAACQQKANCTDSNCATCAVAATCTACNPNYIIATGTCIRDICNVQYCTSCNSSTVCTSCMTNFVIAKNGTLCAPSCTIGNNPIANCMVCNSSTTCQICATGFTVSQNGAACASLCSIANCTTCYSATTCVQCAATYIPSPDGTSCVIACPDMNCALCKNAKTCGTCNVGYAISSTTGKCQSLCRHGQVFKNNKCTPCKSSLSFCNSCAVDINNATVCTVCSDGYYLNSGACLLCSTSLANCIECVAATKCTHCDYGYILSTTGVCSKRSTCTVKNCDICQSGNSASCSACSNGFSINTNGGCSLSCSTGQVLISGVCDCPYGSYSSGTACVACSDANCISCTADYCLTCLNGYYVSGSTCAACSTNCLQCSDAQNCLQCQPPYSLLSGSCSLLSSGVSVAVDSNGNVFTCDPGCDSCSLGTGNILICDMVTSGYTQIQGVITKCDPTCKTCSTSITTCLSCYGGFYLTGGVCNTCTDTNALTCSSTDATFSLSCKRGFTAAGNSTTFSTGVCQACADNCNKCDINGAGTCDSGQCQIGYVQQTGNTNCTQCFSGCPSCDPNNLMTCLSCGVSRYTDSLSQCQSCPTGCKDCTSNTTCQTCFVGFLMVGTLCNAGPTWPCVGGTSDVCTKCVNSFTLTSGTCIYNSSCNSTSTCTSCVYGYYLVAANGASQGACLTCPSIKNCLTCDPSNTTNCFFCSIGYYVSNGSCSACPTGCAQCSSSSYCSKAQAGYYLTSGSDGLYNGMTGICASPCLTCDNNPNFCISCVTDYYINGSACFSTKMAQFSMVFSYPGIFQDTDSEAVATGKIMKRIGFFSTTICGNLPKKITASDPNCRSSFRFQRFRKGSIAMDSQVSGSGYTDTSSFQSDLAASNVLPGATVISTSSSVSGFSGSTSGSNSEGSNLGLILGVAIPLGVLLIIIIAIIVYSKRVEETDIYGENVRVGETEKVMNDDRENRMEKIVDH